MDTDRAAHAHDAAASIADEFWTRTGGDDLLGPHAQWQDLFEALPGRHQALALVPGAATYLVCIDDRLVGIPSLPAPANYVHMAGEGILNPHAQADLQGRIAGVVPHEGCGAKALYCVQRQITTGDPDTVGMQAVDRLAAALGVPVVQRITRAEIAPIHFARAVYYDGTGRFDWSRVLGLPPGFVVSRGLLSDSAYAQTEVTVAMDIALGGHGFGARFTAAMPLYVVAVTDQGPASLPMETLVQELQEVAQGRPAVQVETLLIT